MLLLVTAFAIWMGWGLKFVRDRKAFLRWLDDTGGFYGPRALIDDPQQPNIAQWRVWLGDFGIIAIGIGKAHEHDPHKEAEARRLFPEAQVFTGTPPP